MGGLFGLASSGIGLLSDRRLKTDIRRVGRAANGLPWYQFRYLWDAPETVREGLMSDDVRAVVPAAVIPNSYMHFDAVDYDLALGGLS
jgi:hypothetical protein